MTVITNSCIICHEGILETDDTMRCTNERMLHIFHTACVTNWASTRPLGEQVSCLLCRVDYFLPIQGSRIQNKSAEELERERERLQQQILELRQQIQERRQRKQEREAQNRSIIIIGLIGGTALCLTRDINFTTATSLGIALILTARILPKALHKTDARLDISVAIKGIVGGVGLGLCISSVALMCIKATQNLLRKELGI
jgi:hypothetical protein